MDGSNTGRSFDTILNRTIVAGFPTEEENVEDSDPVMLIVIIGISALLLVLVAMVIAFVVCRLRDRWRARNKEPELLTFCTTIDSLQRSWMVGTERRNQPFEVPTLLIRGKADGSSIKECQISMDDILLVQPHLKMYNEKKDSDSCSSISDRCSVYEVEAEICSPVLHYLTYTGEPDQNGGESQTSLVERERHLARELNSETMSACHSVGTCKSNFTEMSTDFTKSCEGLPYIDDDYEFSCEDNVRATTRLCRSVDCLSPVRQGGSLSADSVRQSRGAAPSPPPARSEKVSHHISGTLSTGSEFDEGERMLGVHGDIAVISLSQLSINIRSCPNSPICKREEEGRVQRSFSREYEGPFSFSESLLYCLPDVNMLSYSLDSSGDEQPAKQCAKQPKNTDSDVASWELKTSF